MMTEPWVPGLILGLLILGLLMILGLCFVIARLGLEYARMKCAAQLSARRLTMMVGHLGGEVSEPAAAALCEMDLERYRGAIRQVFAVARECGDLWAEHNSQAGKTPEGRAP